MKVFLRSNMILNCSFVFVNMNAVQEKSIPISESTVLVTLRYSKVYLFASDRFYQGCQSLRKTL